MPAAPAGMAVHSGEALAGFARQQREREGVDLHGFAGSFGGQGAAQAARIGAAGAASPSLIFRLE